MSRWKPGGENAPPGSTYLRHHRRYTRIITRNPARIASKIRSNGVSGSHEQTSMAVTNCAARLVPADRDLLHRPCSAGDAQAGARGSTPAS